MFLDRLSDNLRNLSAREAFRFLEDGREPGSPISYGELDARARGVGAELRSRVSRGDRVLLAYPPGLDFVAAFLGCLFAGVVAVPAHPPGARQREGGRLAAILGDCDPRAVLTVSSLRNRLGKVEGIGGDSEVPIVPTDTLLPEPGWEPLPARADDLAFLQYTSGSTGMPKGVRVTHGNLEHNERSIQRAFRTDERSVIAGWLPLFHDMGLIGNVLHPLWLGARCILMSPTAFLQRPLRWLAVIDRYRATVSGGPDFAYALCARRAGGATLDPGRDQSVDPSEMQTGLDLSCWRVAFDGSEPVRAATLDAFTRAFAPYGFRREAFFPCYGLAEATLFVSGGPPEAPPVEAVLDPDHLGVGETAREVPRGTRCVGSGRAEPAGVPPEEGAEGAEVVIVEPESRHPVPDGTVGEIWVRGPSVASGYWRRPEQSAETFGAALAGARSEGGRDGPWLRTGDLGLVREGELFVTGRGKDLIILRGRNVYPQDVERTVEAASEVLRLGGCGAFSIEADGEERLVVVAEVHRRARLDRHGAERLQRTVRQAVAEEHDAYLHDLVLLRQGTLPKTTSGKVRRHACRAGYLEGSLDRAATGTAGGRSRIGKRAEAERAGKKPRTRLPPLETYLATHLRELGLDAPAAPDTRLAASGLDSLLAAELSVRVERDLGAGIPLAVLLGDGGLATAADGLRRKLRGSGRDGTGPDAPGAKAADTAEAEAVAEIGDHPASWQQQGIWFLESLAGGRGLYNVAAAASARPPLDPEALATALDRLVARHGALRTRFVDEPDGLVQRIAEPAPASAATGEAAGLEIVDARAWSGPRCRSDLLDAAHQPFDLEHGPPLRLRLLRRKDHDLMLLAVHHTVVDFLSLVRLVRELGAFYSEAAGGPPAALPPLTGSYPAYARAQHLRLSSPGAERLARFWERHLTDDDPTGEPPRLELPTDRPRPPRRGWDGDTVVRRLPPGLSADCGRLASGCGTTLYALLLAGFGTLLGRLAGQEEVVVGTPAAGRTDPSVSDVVGLFADPMALRIGLGAPTFEDLVTRVAGTVAEALDHQDYPFALLARRLQRRRDPGRSPLFDVMLVLDRVPGGGRRRDTDRFASGMEAFALRTAGGQVPFGPSGDVVLESLDLPQLRAPLDLTLAVGEVDGQLVCSLLYDRALFDRTTTHRWLGHLETLLAAAADDPSRPLDHLPALGPAQRTQILREWSGAGRAVRPPSEEASATLHGRFLEQARHTPDAVAVESPGGQLTYAFLERASAHVARSLLRRGVTAETRVAVRAVRSPGLLVALLGILRAGAAYVPIDPAYPAERRALMLGDSGARWVLSPTSAPGEDDAGVEARSTLTVARCLEEDDPEEPLPEVPSGSLAYLIYTSGSTGRPKAVAVAHRGAAALLDWAREAFSGREMDGVLASTSACFDVSVFELFAPLALGGRVLLADDVLALPTLAAAGRVTLLSTVPSPMAELLRLAPLPESLETVALAGEALPGELVRTIGRRTGARTVWNLYGPSEDTVYSTAARLDATEWAVGPDDSRNAGPEPSIGRPLPGTRVHVADAALRPVPPGTAGELLLGGPGTARGYHGRPGATADRLVPDPWGTAPGGRLYRTGDRVRFRADGELEFLGRLDDQVKVRGFRVEPGEVTAAITALPGVAEAVAVGRDDALHAYVVPGPDDGLEPSRIRDRLAETLPAHLVPATVTELERLPRTATGKVDRRALPSPRRGAGDLPPSDPPRGEVERTVAALWQELLDLPAVGRREDFFSAGGHSLLAARLAARLRATFGVDLPLAAVYEAPTVEGQGRRLAAVLGGPRSGSADPPRPLGRSRAPLSSAQERLWLLSRLEDGGSLLAVPFAIHLAGPLDLPAFADAWREVGRRHGALRTRLPEGPAGPEQIVDPPPAPGPLLVDLSGLPAQAAEQTARRLADEAGRRPFDLACGPLVRLQVLRRAPDRHTALLSLHHTVVDGWSLGLILGELAPLYGAFLDGRPSPLPPQRLQYTDFAEWERERLADDALLASEVDHWRDRLAGSHPVELPVDRPRGRATGFSGSLARRRLAPGLAEQVRTWSRREGTTAFVTLLSAFEVLLARTAGTRDVVVGTPVASRPTPELETVVGCFLDTVALRTRLSADATFRELTEAVRATTVDAFAHARVPFDRLVAELAPRRDGTRHPFFETLFVLQNAPLPPLALPAGGTAATDGGVGLAVEPLDQGGAQYELSLEIEDRDGELACVAEYRRELFDPATVGALLERFERLLVAGLERPETPVAALPILSEAERHQVLTVWSGAGDRTAARTEPEEPTDPATAFAAVARDHPDRAAVVGGDTALTYGALCAMVARGAARLAALGAGAETVVGVHLERSPEAIATLFAVLESGAAYLPLDPEMPAGRLRYLLRDARPALVVSDDPDRAAEQAWAEEGGHPGPRRITSDALLGATDGTPTDPEAGGAPAPSPVSGDAAAYVIYTSGTTGRPKGVVVGRRAFASYVDCVGRSFALGAGDRVLQFTSLSFDASIEEVFCTLGKGATLVLRDDAMLGSVQGLVDRVAAHRVTVLDFPTAYWHRLVAAVADEGVELPEGVRLVILGGEQARPDRLAAWRRRVGRRVRLVNTYGPTEATVTVSHCEISRSDGEAGWQGAIGLPIPGARIYLLDERMEPVAPGASGELWIGGRPLGRGYLGRPAATAERFRPDPFGPAGGRLYATGDLARHAPGGDGILWFLGRVDRQVKLRGFRIEPAEVEAALERHDAVTEAVVGVREAAAGDPRLVAWVRPPEGMEPAPATLLAAVADELPAYMVPSAAVRVTEIPRLTSGKVALDALPDPRPGDLAAPVQGDATAATPTEELVGQVWAEVLGLPPGEVAGPDADFFALGGHSILATQAIARLRQLFGVDLPLRSLFDAPTVRQVARRVERADGAGDPAPPLVRGAAGSARRLSYSQERLWFLDRVQRSAAYNLTGGLHLKGALSAPRLAAAVRTVVARHEVLRSRFVRRGEEPVQEVVPRVAPGLPVVDLSGLPEAAQDRQANRCIGDEAGRLFDLAHGPLLRTLLVRRSATEHDLVTSLHHTVGDAWSVGLLRRELAAAYAGEAETLAPLPLQYGDWAEWQRSWLEAGEMERQIAFWRRRLADLPTLELPTDHPRPETPTHRGALVRFTVPAAVRGAVDRLARRLGATPFMVLLAAFDLLLVRWSGQREAVVGTDVAGRRHREVEPLVGFFVNSLVLRTDLGGDPPFAELVARVRDTVLEATAHQEVPFHRVVEALNPRRRPGANPLFQAMFILESTPRTEAALPGLEVEPLAWETTSSAFDLSLTLEPQGDGLAGTLRYSTELFAPSTADRLVRAYRELIEAAVDRPDQRLAQFDVLMPTPHTGRSTVMKNPKGRLGKLLRARPQSVGAGKDLVSIAPLSPSGKLPLLASPEAPEVDLAAWLGGHRERVETALDEAGAVLFRGFEVQDLATFESTVRAFGSEPLGYGERSSPRTALSSGVFTSTDHPADQPIVLHLEQSYTLDWPTRIWFGCLEPAPEGGATPLADSRRILARIDPEIVDELERRDVMYVRNYGDGLGLTWQVAFQTDDPEEVEAHCARNDIACEWRSEGRLRTRQVRPPIRLHPRTGERLWFNHAVFFHVSSLDPDVAGPLLAGLSDDELPFNTLYGDGEPIPDDVLDHLRAAFAAETVRFPWQRGDLLLVDNMLAAHGRDPFSGPRRVVVAMTEPYSTVAPRRTMEA